MLGRMAKGQDAKGQGISSQFFGNKKGRPVLEDISVGEAFRVWTQIHFLPLRTHRFTIKGDFQLLKIIPD